MIFLQGGVDNVFTRYRVRYKLFRYSFTDPEFTDVLNKLDDLFRTNFVGLHPANNFPWLRHLGFLFSAVSYFSPACVY